MSPKVAEDASLVSLLEDQVNVLASAAMPGAYLVDIFPVMKCLPTWLAPWKKKGLEWHTELTLVFQRLCEDALKRTVSSLFCLD